tara:strand:- start:7420 stop:7998 length:579 start_codon:yes stop_codon:yes gene_type:complete
MRLLLLLFLSFLILISLFLVYKDSSFGLIEKKPVKDDSIANEIELDANDLISLSNRISIRNIYLNLNQIEKNDLPENVRNLLAYKKIENFNDSFSDVIQGDILNIDLFGKNFQEKINTVKKNGQNKVIILNSKTNENESFLVIGKEISFGKFHLEGDVYLLKRDSNISYIINTAEAGLVIPQFTDDDYSIKE